MGLPNGRTVVDKNAARFSDDILKIEISGPDQHQFSVVDVPGLFRSKCHSRSPLMTTVIVRQWPQC